MKRFTLVIMGFIASLILSSCVGIAGVLDEDGGSGFASQTCGSTTTSNYTAPVEENIDDADAVMKRRLHIWEGLLERGFNAYEAAGIMANLSHESGFDPTIAEHSYCHNWGRGSGFQVGWGLVQWTWGRHDNVRDFVVNRLGQEYYASQCNGRRDAILADEQKTNALIDAQLDYLIVELKGPYKTSVADRLVGAHSPEVASRVWTLHYEIPANKEAQAAKRAPEARAYYDLYKDVGQTNAIARQALESGEAGSDLNDTSLPTVNSAQCALSFGVGNNHTVIVGAQLRNGALYGEVCFTACVQIDGTTVTTPVWHGVNGSSWPSSRELLPGTEFTFPTPQRAFVAALALARADTPYAYSGGRDGVDANGFVKPSSDSGMCGGSHIVGYDCSGLTNAVWFEAGGSTPSDRGPTAASYVLKEGHPRKSVSQRIPGDILAHNNGVGGTTGHAAIYLGSSGGREWLFHAANCNSTVGWAPFEDNGSYKVAVSYDTNNGKILRAGQTATDNSEEHHSGADSKPDCQAHYHQQCR